MIDLHLHTTASDGQSTPEVLVDELAAAGMTIAAVTDHDTTASIEPVTRLAHARGIRVISGIEITAVAGSEDVHVLGYGFDPGHAGLAAFLSAQRTDRRRRLEEMRAKLSALGFEVALDTTLDASGSAKALGRPMLAAALMRAGHARSMADAFERFLGTGRPAFVARRGATPAEVVHLLHAAGGIASLAHPAKLKDETIVEPLAAAGLDAIEVYHPDHNEARTFDFRARARRLGLLITGGSDFHGSGTGRVNAMGQSTLPPDEFARLAERLRS